MPRHLNRINCSGLSITLILLSVISSYSASAQSDFGIGVAYSIQFGGPAVSVRYWNAQVLIGYDATYYDYEYAYGIALRYNQPVVRWKRFRFKAFAQIDPGRLATFIPRTVINNVELSRGDRQFYWDETDWRFTAGGSVEIRLFGKQLDQGLFLNLDLGYSRKKSRRRYILYRTASNTRSQERLETFWRLVPGAGLHYYF
ncbi:MAG: hypothetical protein OXE59_08840 [Bacteroidetes bacterium]|nr:hypothetical protein [Bacteroidota bacterium]